MYVLCANEYYTFIDMDVEMQWFLYIYQYICIYLDIFIDSMQLLHIYVYTYIYIFIKLCPHSVHKLRDMSKRGKGIQQTGDNASTTIIGAKPPITTYRTARAHATSRKHPSGVRAGPRRFVSQRRQLKGPSLPLMGQSLPLMGQRLPLAAELASSPPCRLE